MAFDDHEKEIGRYQAFIIGNYNQVFVMDTINGEFVKTKLRREIESEIKNNPNKLD